MVDADYSRAPMDDDAIDIRELAEDDLEAVVAFSLRAWEPVFASVQAVLGDEIFLRLHPDWRASQATTVRSWYAFRASSRSSESIPTTSGGE